MRITLLATMFALFYAFNAVPHDEILVAAAEREDSG